MCKKVENRKRNYSTQKGIILYGNKYIRDKVGNVYVEGNEGLDFCTRWRGGMAAIPTERLEPVYAVGNINNIIF